MKPNFKTSTPLPPQDAAVLPHLSDNVWALPQHHNHMHIDKVAVMPCYRMDEAPRSQSATGRRTLKKHLAKTLHLYMQDLVY